MKIDLDKNEIEFLINGMSNGIRGLDYPESYPPFIERLNSIKNKLESAKNE